MLENHAILDKKIYQGWLKSISNGFDVLGLYRNEKLKQIEILVRLYTNTYESNKEKYQEMKFLNLIQNSNCSPMLQNIHVLKIEDPRHRKFYFNSFCFLFFFFACLYHLKMLHWT